MASKNVLQNDIIAGSASNNDELYLISEGTVSAQAPGIKISLSKGDVIGALEVDIDIQFK